MSKNFEIIAIDLGAHSLKVGFFRAQGDGLVIDGFTTGTIGADSVNEEQRNAAITSILKQQLQGRKLGNVWLAYSISGQSVFSRFIKLPSAAPDQVDQMVQFEAQQNVPFPLGEVVWDYQLMSPSGNPSDMEAVIIAIKADLLDRLNESVVSCGCFPKRVDVAPLALYNAVRFNYPEAEGCTLVLDIGAKSTQFVFVEQGRIFVRGVPIAGNQLTQAIATEFGCSTEDAERIKCEKGFVGLGGAYEDPADEEAARASKIIRGILTRLHAEINRSIMSYRTQQGGQAPSRILLAGGSGLLPYMDIFFSEKLKVPVEFFNPLRNVIIGNASSAEAFQAWAPLMGETVGTAIRAIAPQCPMSVNLTPAGLEAQSKAKQNNLFFSGIVATLLLLFGLLWLTNNQEASLLEEKLAQAEQELAALKGDADKLKQQQKLFGDNIAKAEQVADVCDQRVYWQNLFADLNATIPIGVWITSMQPMLEATPIGLVVPPSSSKEIKVRGKIIKEDSKPNWVTHLVLEGRYENLDEGDLQNKNLRVDGQNVIREFVNKLTKSACFDMSPQDATNPDLVQLELVSQTEKRLALNFKIRVKLKMPIHLVPKL